MVTQQRSDGGIEWQIRRPFNQSQALRKLLHKEAIADATFRAHVEDSILATAAIQNALLDDVIQRRQIADVTRPNFVE